jgi:hypothetical protein
MLNIYFQEFFQDFLTPPEISYFYFPLPSLPKTCSGFALSSALIFEEMLALIFVWL